MRARHISMVVVALATVAVVVTVTNASSQPPKKATYNSYEAQTVSYAEPGESAASEVNCPPGEVAVSGSADVLGSAAGSHQEAVGHGHTWLASVDAGSGPVGVKAHVVCARGTEDEHDEAP